MNAKPLWLRVNRLIKTKKTTQKDLAEYLGLPHRTLQNWMYRGLWPLISEGYRMSIYFGVSVEYLVTGKEKKEQRNINAVRSLLKQADEKLQNML